MLETKGLCKVYKPKKGVPVTALDKVSLKFGEKGMVFLLGKSGSGKSTLLNLLGGLDKYDDGEIIIKGVSSKDFKQQHFDSYRNTYVGFIFQEYNILEEFSVGANIALALELQGKKATDEAINDILKEVDLDGYGNRKPNELSGGQKQRVAIARALVKNPKIIMADEPTGALDSNTGRQVFDTLKKLSKEKLVIIVSHDREFSELYADRIIELSDGKVISDVELDNSVDEEMSNISYDGDMIEIAKGYHLTEEDRVEINEYIEKLANEDQNAKLSIARGRKIKFKETNQDDIQMEDGSAFALIKSKLPMKNAFKIGASGLKHKKFRLVITIILSCVAFGLFGLADTASSYDHIKTSTNSFIDSNVNHLSLRKAIKEGNGIETYYSDWDTSISKEELEQINKDTGINFYGVVEPFYESLGFSNYDGKTEFSKTYYDVYANSFSGYAEINKDMLDDLGYEILAGELPQGNTNEIAISKYIFETFKKGKYVDLTEVYANKAESEEKIEKEYYVEQNLEYEEIKTYEDILGKKLHVGIDGTEYVVTAVIDTKFDLERYLPLTEEQEYVSNAEELVNYALASELYAEAYAGLNTIIMMGEGSVDKVIAERPKIVPLGSKNIFFYGYEDYDISADYLIKFEDMDMSLVTWLDGERTELGEKEIIIDSGCVWYYGDGGYTLEELNLNDKEFNLNIWDFNTEEDINESGYKIVGIIDIDSNIEKYNHTIIFSDDKYKSLVDSNREYGEYGYVVAAMPENEEDITAALEYCYKEDAQIQYHAQNAVSYELDSINEVLKVLAKVFMYIGIGFALFASLMLANFIGTSISYKKQEIGILRAIGSRSNDVFRIFFSESFIIAMINFVISAVGVSAIVAIVNAFIRENTGILITILNFGPRQIILLFVISVAVAFIASFLPVKKIASKRPIDAIRNR